MTLRLSRRLLTLLALAAVTATIFFFSSGSFQNMRGSLLESYTLFYLFDTNNDSKLSETEMRKGFAKAMLEIPLQYVKYDVNRDNKVDQADMQDIIDSLRAALQSVCGNGVKESGEQCDAGTQNGVQCSVAHAGLQCTYCTTECTNRNYSPPPLCGNGYQEGSEQCDDGNTVSQDNCSSTCIAETHYGCQNKACAVLQGFGTNTCTNNSQCLVVCGDGVKDSNEQCDDGNKIDNDTCNNSCQTLQQSCTSTKPFCAQGGKAACCGGNQWTCTLENNCSCYCSGSTYVRGVTSCPTYITNPCVPPASICGNGVREASEQCDDGNYAEGDGCSSTCTLPACGPIVEYNVKTATSGASDIVLGPDNNLWFTEYWARKIGRITPAGVVSEFISQVLPLPNDITVGKDGNLWFTNPGRIGKVTQTGAIKYFPVTVNNDLYGIAGGSDGNLWITNGTQGGDSIIRMSPQGTFSYFPVASNSMPVAITSGPDNNLWFTELKGNAIGRLSPDGTLKETPLKRPRDMTTISAQSDITPGPDGNIWFTIQGKNSVGRITTASVPVPTEFALASDRYPTSITAGQDGKLWFTQGGPKKIGKITSTGAMTELALPPGVTPDSITAGPGGYLWYTDTTRNKIGKIAASCTAVPFCGSGIIDSGEDCDDGNQNDFDACPNTCKTPVCGNGVREGTEQCDTWGESDECLATCRTRVQTCGDGVTQAPEQCDDANTYNDDSCSNQCTRPVCGDGVRQGDYEQCDDGNNDPTDDCTVCRQAYCGDGFVHAAYEECDYGPQNGRPNVYCTTSCQSTIEIINF